MRRRSTDYGRTVAFPVAVVGRDGRVRHCDFDESVRMYARRLHVAAARAADTDRARDEVEHCRARLEQLRRSYLERHAHAVLGSPTNVWGTLLAADLLAFLHRCFPASMDQLLVQCTPGEDVAVVRVGGRWGLVQAWVLAGPEAAASPARAAYHDAWELLATTARPDASATESEQLWAAWRSHEVAVILSGVGAWQGPVPEVHDDAPSHEEAWGAAVEAAWDHRHGEALTRFEEMAAERPEALAVAQAAGLMALAEGEPERAAFHAEGGLLRVPGDPLLRGVAALARARLGTLPLPDRLPSSAGDDDLLRVTHALQSLANVRWGRARSYLRHARGAHADTLRRATRGVVLRWGAVVAVLATLAALDELAWLTAIAASILSTGLAAAELAARAHATLRARRLGLLRIDYASLLPRLHVDPHRPA